jgi:E3 ubiquitin-protein ligase HERC2
LFFLSSSSNPETQVLIVNGIGKDLSSQLCGSEHQKTFEEIIANNSSLIGSYDYGSSLKKTDHNNHSFEKLSYFESEKVLAWILGMRSNILQRASSLSAEEISCSKMLNSIILRGGLQTHITNPFDEEKFEARSSGSTAGSTPTTDVVHLLGEPVQITQCPPLQFRIQSFIYGLAEGRTNETTVW